MGKFYSPIIWLENREIDLLKKHNFKDEVMENEICENDRWILLDLEIKGFLRSFFVDDKKYYQGCVAYKQVFQNIKN
jgi:hypothetical protein